MPQTLHNIQRKLPCYNLAPCEVLLVFNQLSPRACTWLEAILNESMYASKRHHDLPYAFHLDFLWEHCSEKAAPWTTYSDALTRTRQCEAHVAKSLEDRRNDWLI